MRGFAYRHFGYGEFAYRAFHYGKFVSGKFAYGERSRSRQAGDEPSGLFRRAHAGQRDSPRWAAPHAVSAMPAVQGKSVTP